MVRSMKPFEIFKTGTHTSGKGVTLSFSDADLTDIAQSYDPAQHEAPIVIGHPKTDGPAYGWVKSLSVRNGTLVAVPQQVDTAFSEMVGEGKFKKVSVGLYSPEDAANPTPGKYHLRHVGFLGAEPPAVKGLKAIEFSAGDDFLTFSELDFSEWRGVWIIDSAARLFRGLRDFMIETYGIETTNRALPQWDIEQMSQGAAEMRAEERASETRPFFSETTTKEPEMTTAPKATVTETELASRLADLERREADQKQRETVFAEASRANRQREDAAFVEAIVGEGRLPIDLKETATALFSELTEGTLTFGEGDGATTMPARDAFRDLLKKLPVPVAAGEHATGDGPDFSDGSHVAAAIETEISAAKARGENLSPADAAARLTSR